MYKYISKSLPAERSADCVACDRALSRLVQGSQIALGTKYQTLRSLYQLRSLELKKSDRRYTQSINPREMPR
ncbi:hypothetical protein QT973_18090 [Microcoleus sp. Z1_A1]|uniref:hypothetical protein n=1 Tax=Microcoleus sp. Z1_A1 TaxID=3055428 RepID=UPI002FD77E9B